MTQHLEKAKRTELQKPRLKNAGLCYSYMQQLGGGNPATLVHDVLKEVTQISITSEVCA